MYLHTIFSWLISFEVMGMNFYSLWMLQLETPKRIFRYVPCHRVTFIIWETGYVFLFEMKVFNYYVCFLFYNLYLVWDTGHVITFSRKWAFWAVQAKLSWSMLLLRLFFHVLMGKNRCFFKISVHASICTRITSSFLLKLC